MDQTKAPFERTIFTHESYTYRNLFVFFFRSKTQNRGGKISMSWRRGLIKDVEIKQPAVRPRRCVGEASDLATMQLSGWTGSDRRTRRSLLPVQVLPRLFSPPGSTLRTAATAHRYSKRIAVYYTEENSNLDHHHLQVHATATTATHTATASIMRTHK